MTHIDKSKFPMSYMLGYGIREVLSGLFILLTFGRYTINLTLPYVLNYHRNLALKKKAKELHKQYAKAYDCDICKDTGQVPTNFGGRPSVEACSCNDIRPKNTFKHESK